MESFDTRFHHPSNFCLSGPSGSGKTTLLYEIIKKKDELFYPNVKRVILAYSQNQSLYKKFADIGVILHHGIPKNIPEDTILILDDLLFQCGEKIANLFVQEGHHRRISTFLVSQNLFARNRYFRIISLNVHYLWIFRNARDSSQIMHLARQVTPFNQNVFKEAFLHATSEPWSYLFIDFRNDTPDNMRFRTGVTNTKIQTVFVPQKKYK